MDEAVVSPAENLRSSRTVHRTLLPEGAADFTSETACAGRGDLCGEKYFILPAKKQKDKGKKMKDVKDIKT